MDLFPKLDRSDRPSSSDGRQDRPAGSPPGGSQARSPRGWVWRGAKLALGAPLTAFPLGQIIRNGRQLGQLVSDLRRGPQPPRAMPQQQNGRLDRAATAFVYGLSEGELDERLTQRRRQTAVTAYLAFGLGWLFVVAWLLRLLDLDGAAAAGRAAVRPVLPRLLPDRVQACPCQLAAANGAAGLGWRLPALGRAVLATPLA